MKRPGEPDDPSGAKQSKGPGESADAEREARARGSFALSKEELLGVLSCPEDYNVALEACARNVKQGPFTATSGLVLEYLLNAATSLLDKHVAAQITRMTLDVIAAFFKPPAEGEMLLAIGGEMGGGVMAGQCAAVASITHPSLLSWVDFAYMRKTRKTSGTLQQIEAPNHITSRTADSAPLCAVWLDEANSSGAELLKNVLLLKQEYNITVVGAIYLVDRSRDRKALPVVQMPMANAALDDVRVVALYDLEPIDKLIARK